jgi:phosphoglycolate phosphatase
MRNSKSIKYILFDLDGTLSDPKEGITKSIRYALQKMGKPSLADEELLWCIGPPLTASFKKLLADDDAQAEKAIAFYRERFRSKGKFENNVYPGIPGVLETLTKKGYLLFIATSKPHIYAKEIVEYFKLSNYFKKIYGPELDGTLSDKSELIAHILKEEDIAADEVIMIGDRSYDIIGAKANGVPSIGVTYGYGSHIELKESEAGNIVDSPQEILTLI